MSSRSTVLGPADIPQDVPQADTQAIAKSQGVPQEEGPGFLAQARQALLGGFGFGKPTTDPGVLARMADRKKLALTQYSDQVVERYGDVLGTRDRGFRDFLRDLAANEASGDNTKSRQIAQQVQESFVKGLQKSLDEDRKNRAEATTQFSTWVKGIDKLTSGGVPKVLQDSFLERLGQITGIEMSKDTVKALKEGVFDFSILKDPDVLEEFRKDPVAFVTEMRAAGQDVTKLMEFGEGLQEFSKARAEKARVTAQTATEVERAEAFRQDAEKTKAVTGQEKLKLIDIQSRMGKGQPVTGPAAVQSGKAAAQDPADALMSQAIAEIQGQGGGGAIQQSGVTPGGTNFRKK